MTIVETNPPPSIFAEFIWGVARPEPTNADTHAYWQESKSHWDTLIGITAGIALGIIIAVGTVLSGDPIGLGVGLGIVITAAVSFIGLMKDENSSRYTTIKDPSSFFAPYFENRGTHPDDKKGVLS